MRQIPSSSLAFTVALATAAFAWATLAAGLLIGAPFATVFYTIVLVLAASCKILALRPWKGRPELAWRPALGFSVALLSACLLAWLSPALVRTASLSTACAVVFSAGLSLGSAGTPRLESGSDESPRNFLLAGLLCAAAFYPLVAVLRSWVLANFYNPTFTLRLFYVSRVTDAGYEGNAGGPFHWGSALAWPVLWWAAVLACAAWVYRAPSLKKMWVLAVAGLAGKFSLASLSADGLASLPEKIISVSTSYYRMAHYVEGLGPWNFIRRFNGVQELLGIHGVSHPFGPELFYWALIRVGGRPWTAALTVMSLTALAPVLLYLLALELGASPRAGLASGLLYLASPAACILSTSGIDCLVSLAFLGCGLAAVRAAARESARWGFLAGLILFACSLLTVAAAYLAVVLALAAAVHLLTRPKPNSRALIQALALVFLLPLLLHLALWAATLGNFNYLLVVRSAAPYSYFVIGRPAYLWSWLNPLLFLGYAGAGTLALAACALLAWLLDGQGPPLAALLPLSVLTGIWLQGLAFGESQRVFHWGYTALSLLALSSPLFRWDQKRSFGILALLATLNVLASIGLMITVLDYW